MSAVAKVQPEQPSLADLAREYLANAGGSTYEAAAQLEARLLKDKALRETIIGEALSMAASVAVEASMRNRRQTIWASASSSKPKTSIVALANGISNSLMNFPLAGGLRLADATPEEAKAQASLYFASADDMGRKARFLAAVADRGKPGVKIGKSLTEADLVGIHQQVMQ